MSTVSVVIATYNGHRFIEEQLETIKNQTKAPDEVIIGDDASSDDTAKIVNNFIAVNGLTKCWKFMVNEANKGYAKNFIDLALMASGDFIFFCDQDDLWDHEKIEKMFKIMNTDQNINLLCSNLEPFYFEEGARKFDRSELVSMTNDGSIEHPVFSYENFFCQRSGCTMCVRKTFLHSIASYWDANWAHDDFVWKFSTVTNSCAVFQYCSMKRRMHSDNTSSIKSRSRDWRIDQINEQLIQYQRLHQFAEKNKDTISSNAIQIIEKNEECNKLRIELLQKRNPIIWLRIVSQYVRCFPRRKTVVLDLYLVFFSHYEGVN